MSSKKLTEVKKDSASNKNALKSFEDKEKITIKDCEENVIECKVKDLKIKPQKENLKSNDNFDNVYIIEKNVKKDLDNKNLKSSEENNKVKRRVGRPLSETYGRKVTIHKTNNYRYLSLQHKKVVNGKELYCHFHLGRLDENNEFIPSINYILSPAEFRNNLIFPGIVKMNIVENMKEGWYSNVFATTKISEVVKPNVVINNDNVILPVKKKTTIKEKIRKEEKERVIEVETERNKKKVLEKEKELEFVK